MTHGEFLAGHALWHQLPGYNVPAMLAQFRRHGLDEARCQALDGRGNAYKRGALASTTVIAFHVSSDTDGLVTLTSIVGLAVYLSLMGIEFFSYIRRLHEVQDAVDAQKRILETANQARQGVAKAGCK